MNLDFSPVGAASPRLEAGYFSPADRSFGGPSPVGTPLMDVNENFEEVLVSFGEFLRDALDATSSNPREPF